MFFDMLACLEVELKRRELDGTTPTHRHVRDLLPGLLEDVEKRFQQKPGRVLEAWAELVGADTAPMARAVRFEKGVLWVSVDNSTLLSLLSRHEKPRLLNELKKRFPSIRIDDIAFRLLF